SRPRARRRSKPPTPSSSPIRGSSRRWSGWSAPRRGSARRERSRTALKADKVYLVGFMAAGKTTVARALAKRLDWRAVDIDELVEQREHQTVADIFAKRGEPYFRAAERAVLLEQVGPRHLVVATGGGTFVDPQNRAVM